MTASKYGTGPAKRLCSASTDDRPMGRVEYSSDGLHVLFHGWNYQVDPQCILWDARTMKKVWAVPHTTFDLASFSPDGLHVAFTGQRQVTLLGLESEPAAVTYDVRNKGWITVRSVFSPDSHFILSVDRQGGPLLAIDGGTGDRIDAFSTPMPPVVSAAWSPDGTGAAGCKDGAILLLDFKTGKVLQTFTGHVGPAWAVTFSPDGKSWPTSLQRRKGQEWLHAGRGAVRWDEGVRRVKRQGLDDSVFKYRRRGRSPQLLCLLCWTFPRGILTSLNSAILIGIVCFIRQFMPPLHVHLPPAAGDAAVVAETQLHPASSRRSFQTPAVQDQGFFGNIRREFYYG